eukprot:jgi/Botrbrau1/4516/Bobra.60_2s0007.1
MFELDCTNLLSGPVRGTSLKWSDDDVLAVCLENGMALLPASLVGPRAVCDLPERRDMEITAQLPPDNSTRNLCQTSFVPRLYSRDGAARISSLTETSSHDWSPAGLSDGGGCLLTVTARDNQVLVYQEPSQSHPCSWKPATDLSEDLVSILEERSMLVAPVAFTRRYGQLMDESPSARASARATAPSLSARVNPQRIPSDLSRPPLRTAGQRGGGRGRGRPLQKRAETEALEGNDHSSGELDGAKLQEELDAIMTPPRPRGRPPKHAKPANVGSKARAAKPSRAGAKRTICLGAGARLKAPVLRNPGKPPAAGGDAGKTNPTESHPDAEEEAESPVEPAPEGTKDDAAHAAVPRSPKATARPRKGAMTSSSGPSNCVELPAATAPDNQSQPLRRGRKPVPASPPVKGLPRKSQWPPKRKGEEPGSPSSPSEAPALPSSPPGRTSRAAAEGSHTPKQPTGTASKPSPAVSRLQASKSPIRGRGHVSSRQALSKGSLDGPVRPALNAVPSPTGIDLSPSGPALRKRRRSSMMSPEGGRAGLSPDSRDQAKLSGRSGKSPRSHPGSPTSPVCKSRFGRRVASGPRGLLRSPPPKVASQRAGLARRRAVPLRRSRSVRSYAESDTDNSQEAPCSPPELKRQRSSADTEMGIAMQEGKTATLPRKRQRHEAQDMEAGDLESEDDWRGGVKVPLQVEVTADVTESAEDTESEDESEDADDAFMEEESLADMLPENETVHKVKKLGHLASAIAYRFFFLRRQNPPDPLPKYKRRGRVVKLQEDDVKLFTQAQKEVCKKNIKLIQSVKLSRILTDTRIKMQTLWNTRKDPECRYVRTATLLDTLGYDWKPPVIQDVERVRELVGPVGENPSKPSISDLVAKRFLQLRHQVPKKEIPVYTKANEHLRGHDKTLIETALAEVKLAHEGVLKELGISDKELNILARTRLRDGWDRVKDRFAEQYEPPPTLLGGGKKAALNSVVTYEVPPDFDPEKELIGANASSFTACRKTLPVAGTLRYLYLRESIPKEELIIYKRKEHLRGAELRWSSQGLLQN